MYVTLNETMDFCKVGFGHVDVNVNMACAAIFVQYKASQLIKNAYKVKNLEWAKQLCLLRLLVDRQLHTQNCNTICANHHYKNIKVIKKSTRK